MTSITREEFVSRVWITTAEEDVYFTCCGRPIASVDDLSSDSEELILVHRRVRGGKGGFGSMLRAIGNQIEKTTNHDMCRDLSGRRMRDVNAEAKLKDWYSKAGERERAKVDRYLEKQRRRREALERGPLHDHKFNDPEFSRRKEKISFELRDAVEAALTKVIADAKPPEAKKAKLWIEKMDSEGSSSGSRSDSESSLHSLSSLFSGGEEEEDESQEPGPSTSTELPQAVLEIPADVGDTESSGTHAPPPPPPSTPPPSSPQTNTPEDDEKVEPLSTDVLAAATTACDLEVYGLEVLKKSLLSRGLKCGGTLTQRAERLFTVRNLEPSQYPAKLKLLSSTTKTAKKLSDPSTSK